MQCPVGNTQHQLAPSSAATPGSAVAYMTTPLIPDTPTPSAARPSLRPPWPAPSPKRLSRCSGCLIPSGWRHLLPFQPDSGWRAQMSDQPSRSSIRTTSCRTCISRAWRSRFCCDFRTRSGRHDNPANSGYSYTRSSLAFSAASKSSTISEETVQVLRAPDPNRLAALSALSAGFGSASSIEE